jgi:DNA-binding transcriptional ArsR family regulator
MLNQRDGNERLDRLFQALADPTRRAIVERLSKGPAAVSALAEPFAMSLPAILQHLGVLEECGVVRTEKTGRVRMCRVDTATLSLAEKWISERRMQWQRRLDRLGAFLAAEEEEGKSEKK